MKRELTERHLEILRWIDTQPHDHTLRGPHDSLTLKGPQGSMTLTLHENERLEGYVEPNPDKEGWRKKHFVLSRLGRSALSETMGEGK